MCLRCSCNPIPLILPNRSWSCGCVFGFFFFGKETPQKKPRKVTGNSEKTPCELVSTGNPVEQRTRSEGSFFTTAAEGGFMDTQLQRVHDTHRWQRLIFGGVSVGCWRWGPLDSHDYHTTCLGGPSGSLKEWGETPKDHYFSDLVHQQL